MGQTTKIDWCDATWNPVTGCLHGCEYCYARRIAERFGGYICGNHFKNAGTDGADIWELSEPMFLPDLPNTPEEKQGQGRKAPYPFGFAPTFRRYKLDEPQHWKKPRTIFVCSTADLFGDWVPDKWIQKVFKACDKAPQHRYLFLTKNPKRYREIHELLPVRPRPPHIAELWFGASYTGESYFLHPRIYVFANQFASVEPLLNDPSNTDCYALARCNDWVIIGAETGNRKDKIVPERSWIDKIVAECDKYETPVFMKESLRELMGEAFRQEFPWEVEQK